MEKKTTTTLPAIPGVYHGMSVTPSLDKSGEVHDKVAPVMSIPNHKDFLGEHYDVDLSSSCLEELLEGIDGIR